MDNQELKRYDRQIILEELGISGQQKLKSSSILVIGAGGLGCPLLFYLVAAGIGKIGITDHDEVDESNLQRQILFNTNDIGKNKAEAAAEKLQLLNPYVNLSAHPYKINPENASSLIAAYDLVIDGSDNFRTRYLVSDTAKALNKPLISGSIFKFEGQVSVFNYKGGPDYRSLYPEPPMPDEVPNCGESGIIGPLAGITGSIMANEAIKVISEFGTPLSGKLLIFNALNNDTQIFSFDKATEKMQENPIKSKPANAIQITMQQMKEWEANDESFCLIDVREHYEFEEFNIGGINISLYELKDKIAGIPPVKKLILCCQSGTKSRIAAKLIKDKHSAELFIINLLNQAT